MTRRGFLALLPLALLPRVARAAPAASLLRVPSGPHRHPTPRPGITAARVLPASRLGDDTVAEAYDMVREIPEIVDGIRCSCGCAEQKGSYSLLSCFEEGGMARHCWICRGQARLVHTLHKEGCSLPHIRSAVDAQYGE
jgi:hypothetical protein